MKSLKARKHAEYTARKTTKRSASKAARQSSRNRSKYAARNQRRSMLNPQAVKLGGMAWMAHFLGLGRA